VFKDEAMSITPPKRYTIEEAMGIIQEEELVEIQPHAIRIRKKTLDKKERQRNRRNGKV
jgi:GTP-binding protein